MLGRLFILFVILPILEIMVLINVSDKIGGWSTFGIVIVTAFLGAFFVRREGANTLRDVQLKMAQGQMPGKELSEGLLLLVAGILLVTPGFITDIMGLLFTIPFTRAPIAAAIVKSFMKSGASQASFTYQQQGFHTSSTFRQQRENNEDGSVFDAEYVDKTNASNTKEDIVNIDYKVETQSEKKSTSTDSETTSSDINDEKKSK
jgi:UPF0716 protein FxsA